MQMRTKLEQEYLSQRINEARKDKKMVKGIPDWVWNIGFFPDLHNKIPQLEKVLASSEDAKLSIENQWCVVEQLTAEYIIRGV